jgi:single-strand DNA-binding protein
MLSDFGRIGRDAQLRYTNAGDAVCAISIAVEYGRRGQDGKRPTQWYEVVLWGKHAEALAPYLLKGKQVHFTGTDLHEEHFSRQDGTAGVKLTCKAVDIKLAHTAERTQPEPEARPATQPQAQPQAAQRQQPRQQAARQPAPTVDDFDDDIPF